MSSKCGLVSKEKIIHKAKTSINRVNLLIDKIEKTDRWRNESVQVSHPSESQFQMLFSWQLFYELGLRLLHWSVVLRYCHVEYYWWRSWAMKHLVLNLVLNPDILWSRGRHLIKIIWSMDQLIGRIWSNSVKKYLDQYRSI